MCSALGYLKRPTTEAGRIRALSRLEATVDEVTACVALVPLVTPLIIEKNTLLSALEKIRKRAKQWAQYNLIKSFGELPVVAEY